MSTQSPSFRLPTSTPCGPVQRFVRFLASPRREPRIFAVAFLLLGLTAMAAQAQPSDDAARRAVVLDNLRFLFPQLADLQPEVGALVPTGLPGLEQGTLILGGGRQTQTFLITSDNKKLWLTSSEALDVSRNREQLAADLRQREEAEAVAAQGRAAKLATSLEGLPLRGPVSAPITVVEFSDFQCPFCARGAGTIEQLLAKYPQDVRFAFKHLPLNIHPWAMPAAIAANCAAAQKPESFWTLHDAYFAHQRELTPQNLVEKSQEYLAGSGVDLAKFVACAADSSTQEHRDSVAAIRADLALAAEVGASRTPAFFVNGHFFDGAEPLEKFEAVIAQIQNKAR